MILTILLDSDSYHSNSSNLLIEPIIYKFNHPFILLYYLIYYILLLTYWFYIPILENSYQNIITIPNADFLTFNLLILIIDSIPYILLILIPKIQSIIILIYEYLSLLIHDSFLHFPNSLPISLLNFVLLSITITTNKFVLEIYHTCQSIHLFSIIIIPYVIDMSIVNDQNHFLLILFYLLTYSHSTFFILLFLSLFLIHYLNLNFNLFSILIYFSIQKHVIPMM